MNYFMEDGRSCLEGVLLGYCYQRPREGLVETMVVLEILLDDHRYRLSSDA
jgi:hypothetical protein